jgi:hypothetical protein
LKNDPFFKLSLRIPKKNFFLRGTNRIILNPEKNSWCPRVRWKKTFNLMVPS